MEELKIDYEFNLDDFKVMENIYKDKLDKYSVVAIELK